MQELNQAIFSFGSDFRYQLDAASVTLVDNGEITGSGTNRNFGTQTIGAAHPARKIVVGIYAGDNDAGSAGTTTSVTLGGNAMTLVVQDNNADVSCSLWVIDEHSAATTATLTTTQSASHVQAAFGIWRVLSYDENPQTDSAKTTASNGTANCSFTVEDGSAVVALAGSATGDSDSAQPYTWTGDITADSWNHGNGSGEDTEGAQKDFATGEAYSTTVQFNSADSNSGVHVCAAWKPL